MKVDERQEYQVTITLDRQEAEILKGLVQNSHYERIEEEPEEESNLRKKLFESLTLGYTGIRTPPVDGRIP